MIDRSFIDDALPCRDDLEVAHYTRIGNLANFIGNGSGWSSAWATPVQFLNDRRELSLGLDVLSTIATAPPASGLVVRSKIDDMTSIGSIETDAFQMSFSGNPDDLGQWRGYAANGFGCAIATTTSELRSVSDVSGWVIYDPKKQRTFARKVLRHLRNTNDELNIIRTLVAAASFMKHHGFASESEYRILRFPNPEEVRFRESGNRLVPYFDLLEGRQPLSIARVIVGPGWQLGGLTPSEQARHHVPQAIYRLLSARGLQDTLVESSALPYDPT